MSPKTYQVVIQPTSLCNLNCAYCYVPNRHEASIMDAATLESVIEATLQSRFVADEVEFLWHAGEPLTAGLDFYARSVELIRRWNHCNIKVMNSIQTNGTLLNERWSRFF